MEEGEKASPKANGICKPWALTEFLKNVAERGHCFGLPGIGAADIPFEYYGYGLAHWAWWWAAFSSEVPV